MKRIWLVVVLSGIFVAGAVVLVLRAGSASVPKFAADTPEYTEYVYTIPETWRSSEKGEAFVAAFRGSVVYEMCEVTGFYHADNEGNSGFRKGVSPDVYVLELSPDTNMEAIRRYIVDAGTYCGGRLVGGDNPLTNTNAVCVDHYWMEEMGEPDGGCYLFLTGRDTDYLCFVLLTEINGEDFSELHKIVVELHTYGGAIFSPPDAG